MSSAGTDGWHVGGGAHHGSVRVLRTAGYPEYDHVARMITRSELADVDLVLAADRGHLRDLRAMTKDHDKVALLRNEILLREVEQAVPPGPIKLLARRDRESLTLQVNQNTPVTLAASSAAASQVMVSAPCSAVRRKRRVIA